MAQNSLELLIEEIKRRVSIIQSEPQNMTRELMIDNLAIDLKQYEEMHKEDCINFSIEWENRRDDEDIKSKEDLYDLIYKK
jgi:hypothetical protein